MLAADIALRWRGDDFEPAIRAAIAKINAADPAALHHVHS